MAKQEASMKPPETKSLSNAKSVRVNGVFSKQLGAPPRAHGERSSFWKRLQQAV